MTPRRTDGPSTSARKSPSPQKPPPGKKSRPLRARSGRRPGDSGTREQILVAALHLFADRGYTSTTIRSIAEAAQVDPALVHHFFSNKEGVFRAAVESQLSVSAAFDEFDAPQPDGSARTAAWLARTYLNFWEHEETRYAMTAIYRAGLADSATSDLLRDRIETSIENWAGQMVFKDHPDASIVSALASSHLAGVAIVRYVLKVEPLASMDFEDIIRWVTPTLNLRLASLDLPDAASEDQD
ncbi:TetR family transcriptional regulator [Streptomyces sp. NPDC032198]|uniref:TetR/AcrR family transcriptional regulator n=1 Tax=Streptomyces sp. NPDC032198 TaxID=3155127 RepID=UPI003405A0E9